MTDTPAPPAPPAPPTPPPAPWHAGVDPEVLGHWQNRSLNLDDPKAVAIEMTKAHRAAEKHIGVPADQLLKLPKDIKDEAGWKDVWNRLGVPADAKEYDFKDVKFTDGTELEAGFTDAMRQALAQARVTRDNAPTVVKAVVKYLEDADKAEAATLGATLAADKAALAKNWGKDFDFNHLKAMEGARRLGITPDGVKAIENQIGYAATMEAMRKIGANTSEDTWISGAATGANVTTQAGAAARLAELMGDQKGWAKRLLEGDPAARREFEELSRLSTGIMEAA